MSDRSMKRSLKFLNFSNFRYDATRLWEIFLLHATFYSSFTPNRSLIPFNPRFSIETNFYLILFYVSVSTHTGTTNSFPRINKRSINIKFEQKIHLSYVLETKKNHQIISNIKNFDPAHSIKPPNLPQSENPLV